MTEARSTVQPIRHDLQTAGPRIAYFEWGEEGQQQVLLVHATGFHARCWDQVVHALGPGYHVYAVDMRGHGRSERVEPYVWRTFGADVGELVEHLGLRGAIGVGHSMGGHCLVQVAARYPDAFSRLLLLDPVIFEPDAYASDRYRGFDGPDDHPVSRRRNDWSGWEEMCERLRGRGGFAVWDPRVLEDYCRYGVLPRRDGRYELACPPRVEASVYLGNTSTDVYEVIPQVRVPVTVLRARAREPGERGLMDFGSSPTWPELAAQFPDGTDVYLPDHTHFIPMEDPDLVAAYIAGEERAGSGSASGSPE
jgi:lipase